MSGWIKLDKDMVDDPRLLEAAMEIAQGYVLSDKTPGGGRDLEGPALRLFACNALLGALVTLWRYADEHIADDDTLPISSDTVDALVGLKGFCVALPDDWIVERDDGCVELPGYCEKNQLVTKRERAVKSNERVRAFRERQRTAKLSGNSVGNAVGNAHVTQCNAAVDKDKDLDSKKKTLRSSSAGDLSPSASGGVQGGGSDGFKKPSGPESRGTEGPRRRGRESEAAGVT